MRENLCAKSNGMCVIPYNPKRIEKKEQKKKKARTNKPRVIQIHSDTNLNRYKSI